MQKAINIENSNKTIVRVLAIADPSIIEENPTGSVFILIEDYTEPPEVESHMTINYPMWDKINQRFFYVKVQYQNTATNELLEIENLKNELQTANENINMLIELQADILGGAI